MDDSIIKTIIVPLSPERAFKFFTEEISDWWPMDTYSLLTKDEDVTKSVQITAGIGGLVCETRQDASAGVHPSRL